MYHFIKRLSDLLLSGLLLLLLLPLFLPIMVLLKLTGEGHIWYFQERIGFKNKPFGIWKFATMLKDSLNMSGGIITLKRDPRITPMGGFLRSSKINELPQLINIFKGDMSFVGPRPVMLQSFEAYPAHVKAVIYDVIPGLTGIGSIIFRDEENLITKVKESGGDTWAFYTDTIYPYKGELEIWYQKNQSFLTDLTILFLTAWVILRPGSQAVYSVFKDLPKRNF